MLSKEVLESHYAEYASQPDEWVANMQITKKSIVEYVLDQMRFEAVHESVKVVVLGASDKRYIPIHQGVFESILHRAISMVTFDLDANHLGGESKNVISHNVTQLFPDAPYDIVFSHELMKFLTPDEQLQTIKNSYQALGENGLAMHILHEPSIKGTVELRAWQHRVDPDELIGKLKDDNISATKLIFNSESDVAWLRETTVIAISKNG